MRFCFKFYLFIIKVCNRPELLHFHVLYIALLGEFSLKNHNPHVF